MQMNKQTYAAPFTNVSKGRGAGFFAGSLFGDLRDALQAVVDAGARQRRVEALSEFAQGKVRVFITQPRKRAQFGRQAFERTA